MQRHTLIASIAATFMIGACGDKTPKSSDANAAEVTTIAETSRVSTATDPVVTGPVSFEDARTPFTEKRYDEAVRLFTTYATEHPENAWGHYMLGLSAWKAGDRDRAVEAFKLALEKDSTHVKSRLNLSRVLIEQGKAQEALPHVEAALAIDSTSSEAFRVLGRVRDELGDRAAAITAFQHAIVLDGRDAWSLNNLANVYLGEGRFEEALGPLARAIEIDSSVASFHNNLGIALERTGRIVQAADAYRAALAIDSTYQKASANQARVEKLQQDSSVIPVDLTGLARSFVEQVKSWE
jgi:tetratricopeptide (TPR) repeat protein